MRIFRVIRLMLISLAPLACSDEVMVVVPVSVVEIQGPGTILAGSSAQYTAIPKDDRGNRLTERTVTWSTSDAELATVSSAGRVSATLGGQVTITANCEGKRGSLGVQLKNPVPVVISTDPAIGIAASGSFELTVHGNGFVRSSLILWDGEARPTSHEGSTTLRATISAADVADARTVPITVFNPSPGGGTSGSQPFRVENPVPVVEELEPSVVTAGTGPFELTVRGSGFVHTSVVRWNGNDRETDLSYATELRASILAQDIVDGGTFRITVFNPSPGGGSSESREFTAENPVPAVEDTDPWVLTAGSGPFELTVKGSGFVQSSVVRWNGQDRETIFVDATKLKAAILAQDIADGGGFQISVINPSPGGGSSGSRPFLTFACSAQSEIPEGECESLIALFASTDGRAWTTSTNWLSTNTPCNWHGVVCDGRSVIRLDLKRNDLTGTIPPELGALSNLERLVLSGNPLTGAIPPELGNLSNLESLFLDAAQLTGTIPRELGSLSNLRILLLGNNNLTGPIPAELGNLSNLGDLRFGGNDLTGEIPPELGNLSKLNGMRFDHNRLTGAVPPELGNLSYLRVLSLSHNQLTGVIPSELGNLSNLEEMYITGNQLIGAIPPELGNLSNLRLLYLNGNQLAGPIPAAVGNLSNLDWLLLEGNQLTGSIPTELGNLSNLENLRLQNNQLTGSIPAVLGNLSYLDWLELGQNQLSGNIPSEFGNLANLRVLYLNDNQLTGPIPAGLGGLPILELIFLQDNHLSGLVPVEVAQAGGRIQDAHGADRCTFVPPGNDGLYLLDDSDYRAADLDGDGYICGLALPSGSPAPTSQVGFDIPPLGK